MAKKTVGIILAGGEGTRLKPLTDVRPKSNVYVGRKRLMNFMLDLFRPIKPEKLYIPIQYRDQHVRFKIRYPSEFQIEFITPRDTPVGEQYPMSSGTADAVRQTAKYYIGEESGIYVIAPCDILTNIDLEEIVDAHVHNVENYECLATIGTMKVPIEDVTSYGVLIRDEKTNRITEFFEKPERPEDAPSNEVNIGIYVGDERLLKYLRENPELYDFGYGIFPELKEQRLLFGHEFKGYWNDIGDLGRYRRANFDLIDGIPGVSIPLKKDEERDSLIGRSCIIKGRVVHSVLGDNVIVDKNSSIENCILVGNNYVESAELSGVIMDNLAKVERPKAIGEDVVLGRNVTVMPGTEISPGVKISPNIRVRGKVKKDREIPRMW